MAGRNTARIRTLIAWFGADTRGTTAVLFAMIATPVLGLGLAGLDYARALGTKAAIQNAADSAATAGAQMLGASHSEIEEAVRGYLRANLPTDRRDLDFVLSFAPDETALTIKIDTTVSTSILGIVGVKAISVRVATTINRPAVDLDVRPAHRGVAPELPDDASKRLPALVRSIPPDQLREAEAAARKILQELQSGGGTADVERLLRELGQLR
ncbi:MAG TPA: pilus assembly protein TadG-related protein [Hyphomicrobium sp.]|nr:pilus assembly protein TadG-related protein [Hyphomicrobium sp.]